jgi:arylsulfatase A-like enzyme
LPTLPENHPVNPGEPEFVSDKRRYHDEYGVETKLAYQEFGEQEWRGYLNAYYRLTELVDAEVGRVLDALEANGLADNTIVVFTSDHGDGAAAHQWSAKLSLYQESAMVPMIISFPGVVPQDRIDSLHLVSQIDIVPTLCDYAGIEAAADFTGRSWRPVIEDPQAPWRDYLVVELADFKPDKQRKGRMLRTDRFKYNLYTTGARNEQLFDLQADPGERRNLAFDPAYQAVAAQHREYMKNWVDRTGDTFDIGLRE